MQWLHNLEDLHKLLEILDSFGLWLLGVLTLRLLNALSQLLAHSHDSGVSQNVSFVDERKLKKRPLKVFTDSDLHICQLISHLTEADNPGCYLKVQILFFLCLRLCRPISHHRLHSQLLNTEVGITHGG